MIETIALIKSLKLQLKHNDKTYKDLGKALSLSEASIKRLFSEKTFTLHRLEQACNYLGLEISELVQITEQNKNKIDQLSHQQEVMLVSDIKYLMMAVLLINHWSFHRIIATYDIEALEAIQIMAKLDKMKIIQLLPKNRTKLMISRNFSWIPNGPIQKFYEDNVEGDFLESPFVGAGQYRTFLTGMLTRDSNDIIKTKLQKLAAEFNTLHEQDESASQEDRFGTGLLMAFRPWELKIFNEMRRMSDERTF